MLLQKISKGAGVPGGKKEDWFLWARMKGQKRKGPEFYKERDWDGAKEEGRRGFRWKWRPRGSKKENGSPFVKKS